MAPPGCLSEDEALVLAVFRRRRVGHGFGLTATTFSYELHGRTGADIRRVLDGLVQRGLLAVRPEVKDFYILTRSGELLSRDAGIQA
jgi:hypothetical protein